ncbi:allatostatin-A receptor-like isoform X1 [Montipora capricornis]|uniref:allatostatin-A receptor-like isoform X1 n=2 Tax=Montipora capricornis TaxID=246305 RepID=UPI0035F11BC7
MNRNARGQEKRTDNLRMPNETGTHDASTRLNNTWLAVYVTEFAVIFLINGFTIITFARNPHLRKRTTYLIINLAVADLLVGGLSGPLHIYHTLTFKPDSGFSWRKFTVLYFDNAFTACSLLNLALLSLERLHATIFPFRHSRMMNSVYLKAVICIWLLALIPASVDAALFLTDSKASQIVWASLIIIVLLIIIVSYMIITFNVKRNVLPQLSGARASDRKLTVTLFIVTALSTLAILPWFFDAVLGVRGFNGLSPTAKLNIHQSINVLFYANSFVNPLIYTLRMQEFRKAVRIWCRKTSERQRQSFQMSSISRITALPDAQVPVNSS